MQQQTHDAMKMCLSTASFVIYAAVSTAAIAGAPPHSETSLASQLARKDAAPEGGSLLETVLPGMTVQCTGHLHVSTCPVGTAGDHLFSQATANLLSHTLGDTHGRHSARLSAANLASAGVARLSQILSHLSGLAGACLTNDHQHLVVGHSLNDLVLEAVDGQAFSLLLDAAAVLDAICGSLQDARNQAANTHEA